MSLNTLNTSDSHSTVRAYLNVTRAEDGRYQVALVRGDSPTRQSFADHAAEVVQRAERIGSIAICTTDPALRQLCHDHHIHLIEPEFLSKELQ